MVVWAVSPELPGLAPEAREADAERRERNVFFPDHGFVPTAVLHRDALGPGAALDGPAIIESMDSTVVLPPGWRLIAAESGVLDLEQR